MRDWDAILRDAIARGLTASAVAAEQICTRNHVVEAATSRGINIPLGPFKAGGPTERGTQKRLLRLEEQWRKRFDRRYPSEDINTFCLRHGCTAESAKHWAASLGFTFPAPPRK